MNAMDHAQLIEENYRLGTKITGIKLMYLPMLLLFVLFK